VCIERVKIIAGPERYAQPSLEVHRSILWENTRESYCQVEAEWFVPLKRKNGKVYFFLYRNVRPRHVLNLIKSDEEIWHAADVTAVSGGASTALSGEEVPKLRDGGIAMDGTDQSNVESGGAGEASGWPAVIVDRRKRAASSLDQPERVVRSRTTFDGPCEDEDLYSATPRPDVASGTHRSSSGTQEPTPPPDAAAGTNRPSDIVQSSELRFGGGESALESITNAEVQPRSIVDLSAGTSPPAIKREPSLGMKNEEDDIDDVEDLEDQVKLIELRRRIRAAKKRQAARNG